MSRRLSRRIGFSHVAERRAFLIESLHIVTLSSFAVAQPLFDLLGRNATFFAAHRSTTTEILLWTTVLVVVVPAGVILVEAVIAFISARVRHHIHTLAISFLGSLVVVPPIVRFFELSMFVALPLYALIALHSWGAFIGRPARFRMF